MPGMGMMMVMPIVMGLVGILITVFVVWKVVMPIFQRQAQAQKLLQTGIPAQARVLTLMNTGTLVNNNPQVALGLEVHPDGRPPYQTQLITIIDMLAVSRVQPGATVRVRFDQNNPMLVALESY